MQIGDELIWKGRVFVLCGFEPMSIPGRRAELEDIDTGEHIRVPVTDLERADKRDAPTDPSRSQTKPV